MTTCVHLHDNAEGTVENANGLEDKVRRKVIKRGRQINLGDKDRVSIRRSIASECARDPTVAIPFPIIQVRNTAHQGKSVKGRIPSESKEHV
jgi:hypothetical protein